MTHITPISRSSRPIPAGVDIGHVHMKTADLRIPHRFYVEILGFDVVAQMPTAIFISSGGYHHHLAFNTWESAGASPPPPGTTGLYHIAIRYPTRAALADALRRLADAKWTLDGASDHGTHEALYLRDGEDNGIELYWDRPQDEWPIDSQGQLKFTTSALSLSELLQVVETP